MSGDYAFNGNWELTRVSEEASFEWDTTTMPDGSEPSSVYLGCEGVAIGAFAEDPDLAWEFLRLTWLSADVQTNLIEWVGSIPVRSDVADSPEVTAAVGAGPFLEQVSTGTRLPITQQENEAQTLFGDTWSAVVSGQLSPADGAERIVTETPGILEG